MVKVNIFYYQFQPHNQSLPLKLIIIPYIAAPISHNLTSTPAYFMPSFVLALTPSKSLLNFGLNATVNAQSIILPFT